MYKEYEVKARHAHAEAYRKDYCSKDFEAEYHYLTVVICARKMQKDWFYANSQCEEHDYQIGDRVGDRKAIKSELSGQNLTADDPDIDEKVTAELKKMVASMGLELQSKCSYLAFGCLLSTRRLTKDNYRGNLGRSR